jgi:hypothetical protein
MLARTGGSDLALSEKHLRSFRGDVVLNNSMLSGMHTSGRLAAACIITNNSFF